MKDLDAISPTAADEPPRKLKLPGADRKGPPKPATQAKKETPKSVDDRHWATEDDELSQRMNAFALEIIGQNLAEEEERDRKAAAAAARKSAISSPHKFKPKPPVKRFAERHPEVIAQYEAAMPPASEQDDYETASEDEYVVETYVRVPASVLSKDVDPEKIGLLVFGNESDAEFFYGVEGDSDDEWLEDDEDENGELSISHGSLSDTVLTRKQRRTTTLPIILTRISTRAMSTIVVRIITVATPLIRKSSMSVMSNIPWTTIMGTMMSHDCQLHIWDFSLPRRFGNLTNVRCHFG